MEVDHIVPRSLGGPDVLDNLALACRSCNGAKLAATTARDPSTGHIVRLFHPRRDAWADYFRLDIDAARIEGITDIGRATVAQLKMNEWKQVQARDIWIVYFGFPDGPPATR